MKIKNADGQLQKTPFWKWIIGYDRPMPEKRTFQPMEVPKLQPCPDCGREVSQTARRCPNCGKVFTTFGGVIVAIIIGLIIGLILFGGILK
jgi:zinc-ribbon domain